MARAVHLRDWIGAAFSAAVALAVVLGHPESLDPGLLALAAVLPLAVWIAAQDLADFTIPDGGVIGLALIGIALRYAEGAAAGIPLADTSLWLVVDAGLVGGVLWALRELWYRRSGADGLGFGDVKLGAAGALLIGSGAFPLALLGASLTGLSFEATARRRAGPSAEPRKIPFGAFLAPAVWFVLLGQILPGLIPFVGGRP